MQQDEFLQATLGSIDLVHNLARRLMRDEHLAEDLVQETYLAAFRAWKRHARPDRVEAWMATITLNLARSSFRRASRRPAEVLDPLPGTTHAGAADTAADALANVERDAVRRAIWDLPEPQRIAVTLVDICGMSTAEAADAAGWPRGTVLSRVHRGRKALATILRKDDEFRDA